MTAVMLENVADATQSVKLHFSTGLMSGGADTSTDMQTDFSASISEYVWEWEMKHVCLFPQLLRFFKHNQPLCTAL